MPVAKGGVSQFYETGDGGVRLFVRASPGAKSDEIAGIKPGADGVARLYLKVTAPPDKGKANSSILKLLAERLGLPKSAMRLAAGETSRSKTVFIEDESQLIVEKLNELMEALNER